MIARHVLSSRPLFVLRDDARVKKRVHTFKLRSELISVEDKRNESEREKTSQRKRQRYSRGELRANKGGETGTWRVCLGQLHTMPESESRGERSARKGGRLERLGEIRWVILD